MRLTAELQNAIEEASQEIDRGALGRAVRELTASYLRGDFKAPLPTAAHRIAYLQVRMPATFAANHRVFEESARMLPDAGIESMLDLGAGPGTSMWAASECFGTIKQYTLVERDYNLAALGQNLASQSENESICRAAWVREDITTLRPQTHDLVVISYALGELTTTAAEKLIATAWKAARKLLVIVEPGTPRNFQRVLAARQTLIAAGAQIAAPCPHHNACPLEAAGDWCHFSERLERTAEHRRLKGGELGYEDEKFSYVIASRMEVSWPRGRIVRHPLFRPGHVQLMLCTAKGLKQETIGKARKELYRAARKAMWGDSTPEWNEKPSTE
jgi:ribosomal protein RSM22 (predicted rRNA methylase)